MLGAITRGAWRREAERPLLDEADAADGDSVQTQSGGAQAHGEAAQAAPTAPDGTPHVGVSRYFKDTVTAVSTRASGLAAQAVGRAVVTSITAPAPAPRPWWSRTAEALRGSFPKTVERSILAYAALVCTLGVTDLFCIPAFPLFWTCAGILPLVSVGVIMLLFGCAYIMALLPSAENMYPAAVLTAGMTAFYTLRLLAVDGLRVRGLYSLGDLLLALISWLQLGVLLRNTRQRRRLAALPR